MKERALVQDIGIDEVIILKKQDGRFWTGFWWLRIGNQWW